MVWKHARAKAQQRYELEGRQVELAQVDGAARFAFVDEDKIARWPKEYFFMDSRGRVLKPMAGACFLQPTVSHVLYRGRLPVLYVLGGTEVIV